MMCLLSALRLELLPASTASTASMTGHRVMHKALYFASNARFC